MRRFLAALFLTLCVSSPASAAPKTRVVFVGDSITYGYGLPNRMNDRWPAVTERLLRKRMDGAVYARAGATLAGNGLVQWPGGGFRFLDDLNIVLAKHPDLVVVELGLNDLAHGYTVESVQAGYNELDRRARAAGVRVVFMTIPSPIAEDRGLNPWLRSRFPNRVIDVAPALIVDGSVPAEYLSDNIHPNAVGAGIIGRVVADRLRKEL